MSEIKVPRVGPGVTPGEALYVIESAAYGRVTPWDGLHRVTRRRYEDMAAALLAAIPGRVTVDALAAAIDGRDITVSVGDGWERRKPAPAPLRDRLEAVAGQWHKTARDMRRRQEASRDEVHAAYLRGQADTAAECAWVLEAHLNAAEVAP